MAIGSEDRNKIGVEEGEELVSSDVFIEGVNDDNLEGAVYVT